MDKFIRIGYPGQVYKVCDHITINAIDGTDEDGRPEWSEYRSTLVVDCKECKSTYVFTVLIN